MLRLNTRTKSKPEEVVKKALGFFGPDGLGLEVTEQSDTCAYFQREGVYVSITACIDDKGTSVDMVTREFEYQVKEFAGKLR
ncbi:MAG: hypothetical protein IBX67_04810 [Dehalococcoidia bacterium]|nr:hypothetical protein [Dehalococcoidia bacterium]